LSRGDDEADDKTIEPECLGEDEDQDHADEELRLLRIGTNSGVSHDADGQSGSEGGQAYGETSGQVCVSLVGRVFIRFGEVSVDDDGGD